MQVHYEKVEGAERQEGKEMERQKKKMDKDLKSDEKRKE